MDQNLREFYFFSDFLNRRVYNASGKKVGKISDLVAERAEPYPMIIGMTGSNKGKRNVPSLGEDHSNRARTHLC